MSKTIEIAAGELAADLTALREDVARLTAAMSELVQGRAETAGHRVSEAVADAKDRISSATADAQDRVRAMSGDIEASIDRHPMRALLIAFGVGLACGVLSRSRS